MKRLLIICVLCSSIIYGVSGQISRASHCGASYNDTTNIVPHIPVGIPGLVPISDSLPPGVNGTYLSDTFYFENYNVLGGDTIYTLKIDSINNLPNGLCWETNRPNNTFAGGETGVVYISGTPYDSAGQYKVVVIVDVSATGVGSVTNQNAEALTGILGVPLRYYIRLNCQGASTLPIDTIREKALDSIFFAYPSQAGCIIYGCGPCGIDELSNTISNLQIMPNPYYGLANIEFNSSQEGIYTLRMTNLMGVVVSSEDVAVVQGANNITQNRGDLPSGIYLLSLSNGQSSITKKVVIGE